MHVLRSLRNLEGDLQAISTHVANQGIDTREAFDISVLGDQLCELAAIIGGAARERTSTYKRGEKARLVKAVRKALGFTNP